MIELIDHDPPLAARRARLTGAGRGIGCAIAVGIVRD